MNFDSYTDRVVGVAAGLVNALTPGEHGGRPVEPDPARAAAVLGRPVGPAEAAELTRLGRPAPPPSAPAPGGRVAPGRPPQPSPPGGVRDQS